MRLRKFNNNYALVRALHALPDGDTVDIYLNDKPFFKELDFTEFTPYIYVPEGKYRLTVYPEGELDKPIISEEIEVNKDDLATIAVTGDSNNIRVIPIKEDKEIADGNNSKIRFVHLVPNGRTVDILLDNTTAFSNIKFGDITPYLEVSPNEYKADVAASENNIIIKSDKIRVNPNRIYTFYAIGNAPNFEVMQSVDGATFLI